ncbi:MAG: rRNA maturation RNase YbeY [Oscillospiraceae bacterium]|jgi:probable rRNA maturation factor|nr:rRNA maturation RNase YbeY [Oscillospiraceae bacterium]
MKQSVKIYFSGLKRLSGIDIPEISQKITIGVLQSEKKAAWHIADNGAFGLSVAIVGKREIRKLNKKWRGNDKVTDVLSFPADEPGLLGDAIICAEKLKAQAKLYGHSETREFAFLLTHSLYHLLGYDHETPDEELVMREKQTAILNSLHFGIDKK